MQRYRPTYSSNTIDLIKDISNIQRLELYIEIPERERERERDIEGIRLSNMSQHHIPVSSNFS